jgi:hypothetical protein
MKRNCILICFVVLVLVSCKTKEKAESKDEKPDKDPLLALDTMGEFEAFAPGGLLYLSVDVKKSRKVIDLISIEGMTGEDAKQILNRTDTISAAFYPKGNKQRLIASAHGGYPKNLVDFSLAVSADWKKNRSEINGASYWYSSKNELSVALNSTRALISDKDPFAPTSGFTNPSIAEPEGFSEFRQGSCLAGWLGSAETSVSAFLSSLEVPFEVRAKNLFFSVVPSGELYETFLRIETESASKAPAIAQLFGLARLLMMGLDEKDPLSAVAKTLFSNPLKQDGAFLTLHIAPLPAERIALLFNTFSLHSK